MLFFLKSPPPKKKVQIEFKILGTKVRSEPDYFSKAFILV